MSRIPPNGTAVSMGKRKGKVSRTGDAPGGLLIEVCWDADNKCSWHKATELDYGQ
jgi:hypothetical protein